jgi:hypothetical protein
MPTLALVLVVLLHEPSPTEVRGRVVDRTGLPLGGAIVLVKGAKTMSVTEPNGHFSIEAPAAAVLVVSLPGFESEELSVPASLPAGGVQIVLGLARVSDIVQVRAPAPPEPGALTDAGFTLTPLDVVRTAGAEADLMRAVATMSGVARVDEGAGLFVRGGDVSEVRVLLDDVPINHPYRYETPTGGFRGAVDPFLTSGLAFSTGGFSAKYGDALSAVLDLRGQPKPADRGGSATAGLAGVSGSVAQPIGSWGGLRITVNRATPRLLFAVNKPPQAFDRYPGGWDVAVSGHADVRGRGRLRVLALSQRDTVGVELEKDAYIGFLHSGTEHAVQLAHWEQPVGKRWTLTAAAGRDTYSKTTDIGVLAFDENDRRQSARVDLDGRASGWTLQIGADADAHRTADAGKEPRRGGDFGGVSGTIGFLVSDRDWRAGTYVEASRPMGRFVPSVGVRLDRFDRARERTVDPRLSLQMSLTARQRIRIEMGDYHQAPSPAYFDAFHSASRLLPMHATHVIVGYELGRSDAPLFLRIEGYRKTYAALPLEDPARGFTSDGYGSATGVDGFMRRIWPRLELRASGSWLNAARRWTPADQFDRYPIPAGTWRPDFSIPLSGQIVTNLTVARPFAIGASWHAAAGRPYTPVVGTERMPFGYAPVWATINSARLPRYERVDLSLSVLRPFESGGLLVLFASLDNVAGRRNFFEYAYSADYTARHPVITTSPRSVYVGATVTK